MTQRTAQPAPIIDTITYLASLASNVTAIDPLLDRLRFITSRGDIAKGLRPEDEAELADLKKQLESYLVKQDPLRSFTSDSLALQVQQHFEPHPFLGGPKGILSGTIVAGVLLAAGSAFTVTSDIPGMGPRFGTSVFYTVLHLGAAGYFMAALASFKPAMRQAYNLIAAGIIVLGLGQLVQPILALQGLDTSPYLSIIVIALTLPGILPMYIGARRYALVLQLRSWAASLKLVGGLAIASALVLVLIPHPGADVPPLLYNFSFVMQGWMVLMTIASVFIMDKVTTVASHSTKVNRSLLHVFIGLAALTVFTLFARNISATFGVMQIAGTTIGVTVVGILLLRAGYLFYARERA